ncbi:MAG TPA: hypothetical protein VGF17_20820 [Phytomonospora sp.]
MTNDLTALRQRIVDDLTGLGFNAHTVMPETAAPPVVWVVPGDPYVTRDGATFGGLLVRHQVNFAAAPGTNEAAAEELDALVLDVLDALDTLPDLVTGDVDRVGLAPINGQHYLAAGIHVTTEIHR